MPTNALNVVRKYFPNVKIVKEAKAPVNVEVTKRDDTESRKKSHAGCAMAVACKRKFHLDGVLISRSIAYLIKNDTATRFAVPERVSREVVSFDRGGGFEPGQYKLSPASAGNRLDYPKHSNHKHTGKSKRPRYMTENVRTVLGSKGD